MKPKHKTAEQLLKENPLTGKLARDVATIESNYQKEYHKTSTSTKQITAKSMIKVLLQTDGMSSSFNNDQHSIAYNGKIICWIADRKNWVAVSTWDKGGTNFQTTRVITKPDMKDAIKMLKERVNLC